MAPILAFVALSWLPACSSNQASTSFDYPSAKTVDTVDTYHGVKVADPYRWLEELDSPETRAWIQDENVLTRSFLDAIPARETMRRRLTTLWNYTRYTAPVQRGGRYFFRRNDGLQNQSVLCVADAPDAEARVLLDPNTLSNDGTVALGPVAVSRDGRRIAYALSAAGSDWQTWHVREVDTGQDLPDRVEWSKFSVASWAPDNLGFYYSRFPEPGSGQNLKGKLFSQKLYYHHVGTPQSEDVVVCEDTDHRDYLFDAEVTEDGRYLAVHVSRGTEPKNLFYYRRLGDPRAPVVKLIDRFEATFRFLGNDGPVFWFLTSYGAPRNRVIAIHVDRPSREHWQELIPEVPETLEAVSVVHDRFLARYLKDAFTQVRIHRLDGTQVRDLPLPGMGSAGGFTGRRLDHETFYAFETFSVPRSIYRYDFRTGKTMTVHTPRLAFDPADYVTEQVRYTSKDGTVVPMFVTHRKDLVRNGQNPTILYGYGGFNWSLTPFFFPGNLAWMERGGVYAQPSLRGGGEYGRAWHLAGTRLEKQNVFDDFMAAAEWLITNDYTCPAKLAISGGSNGGLLVGACMVQRPELFGACLPAVGVMDMLRFPEFTIGHAWISDYGSPKNPEEFRALRAYSPYHNLKSGVAYPATLITTADHDDRVFPAHSFKFAARLQACQAGDAPVLIRIETRAGHGAGKPTEKRIQEEADVQAFLDQVLGQGDAH